MLRVEPQPRWSPGTDLKVVFEWQIGHYCVMCFLDICDQCDGTTRVVDAVMLHPIGQPCHCPHLHEHEYWDIE